MNIYLGYWPSMNTAQTSYNAKIDFSQRSSLRAAMVWGLAAIFYFYEIMLLVSPSVMVDDLTLSFSTSAEQLGSLAAFYYYAYASMQIPVGLLMDSYGPRILLTFAAGLCAIGCLIFGFAPTLIIAEIGRFVMGIGGSFAVVGCLKLASIWFPVNRFALLTGVMVAVGMMGGVFGQAPVAKLVMSVGWRQTAYLGALIGAILSIIIWFVVADHPLKIKIRPNNLPSSGLFSDEVKIWFKFIAIVVAFCFPFFVNHQLEGQLNIQQITMLYLFFYMGWTLCFFCYKKSKSYAPTIRVPLACIGLISGAFIIILYPLHYIQFGLLALSLGFFARLLFSSKLPIPPGLYEVMKIPQVWIASLYAGLMFVPTTGFGQLWGVPYFTERFQIEKDAAGFMVSMIFFGWAFGGPLYGWISDHIGRRKLPMGFAAASTLLVMMAILYVPVSGFEMKILMFLLGACSSGFILAFSMVREINAPALTGTAIGFINTLNNLSGALAQPVVGKLLDKYWEKDKIILTDGSPFYSIDMYNEAFLFLPICIVFALLMIPFIKETYCKVISQKN